MSKTTLILDSSQISKFLSCPLSHQLAYEENLELSGEVREDFAMGTYGHKLLEIYYKNKALGLESGIAASKALNFNIDEQTCKCGHDVEHHLGEEHIDRICSVPALIDPKDCGCQQFEPIRFPLADKTRVSVRERFELYWMKYMRGDFTPEILNGEPQIEKGFSYPLLDTPDRLYVLEGRIDFIGSQQGTRLFMDHKWQGRSRALYKKDIQFRNYALVTGCSLGFINYVRLKKEIDDTIFERAPINFNALERDYWKDELIGIYDEIAAIKNMAEHGGQMPKNRASCSGKFGYPCEFTKLCDEINPSARENLKKSYYHIKKEWKPW